MPRQPLRTAAATFQVGLGLLAVLLCGYAMTLLIDPSEVESAQGMLAGICALLGISMFAVWMAARTRRRWLLALMGISAVLTIVMIMVTVTLYAPARVNEQLGVWTAIALAAVDAVLWLLITVAAIIELRFLSGPEEDPSNGWFQLAAIVAPVAIIAALTVILVSAGPGWLIRLNSRVGDVTAAAEGQGSVLSGDTRWTVDLESSRPALALDAGMVIAVPRDQTHSAGVIMIDPINGDLRWRYQLQGADGAPELAVTDGGRGVVVSFDGSNVGEDVVRRTFTLKADTGEVQAIWPTTGAVMGTDPPVLFDHDAQGTNSVIAISPTGGKLWTYRPERCADPRSVSSTPSVMVVRARECDKRYNDLQILGLDAETGERRWVQDAPEDAQESGPEHVLVRRGFQLELSGDQLIRRNLDTGAIDWSAPSSANCQQRYLVGSGEVAYLGQCDGRQAEATAVAAYAAGNGQRAWRRQLNEPIKALTAVDDHRVLAVTSGASACTVRLVQESGSSTMMKLPGGGQAQDREPGSLDCNDADLIRVGDSVVLQIRLVERSVSGAERYRFIGLS